MIAEPQHLCDMLTNRGLPEGNHVYVTPRGKPQLRNFVKSISLNCVDHEIKLDIAETPAFSTFDWIYNINVTRAALLKSAFGDLEQDALAMEFKDDADHAIAVINLKGLELLHHECLAGRERTQPLVHSTVIKYDKLELIHVEENDQARYNLPTEAWMREKFDLHGKLFNVPNPGNTV